MPVGSVLFENVTALVDFLYFIVLFTLYFVHVCRRELL